ncbi:BrnA antitoxin family protein [Rhodopseudomonas sp. P1]|uniref:BrnA antitoxin family protein n=1 Tax=Rhodopseudomonas sp. P1 TaxID=3434357 RepID=UPI0031FD85FC
MNKKLSKTFQPGRGYSKQDWDDVESPELTAEQIKELRPFAEVFPDLAASIRRGRGPNKAPTKRLVSLRLSPEVIDTYKAGGPGWQSRIDADLRRINKIK